ncbi:MAG: hypothetical protein IIA33_05030 [Planctomycetes bacterium]|nr:hypothetical protein [Planctomycetota bacterium]
MSRPTHSGFAMRSSIALIVVACCLLAQRQRTTFAGDPPPPLLPTTLEDFFLPGTQPDPDGIELTPIEPASPLCQLCHGFFTPELGQPHEAEPYRNWAGSMMAQASRDPIFYACLTIANQDAGESGDLCIRCHAPGAWLGGRSTPTDGSAFGELVDFDGVTCHFCHRLVNPAYDPAESPAEDVPIIFDLIIAGLLPAEFGSAQYVVDPDDVRRGPESGDDWPYNPHGDAVNIILSPFHRQADMCGTCHDVSNPAFSRQPDGSYVLNDFGQPHPTMHKADMFPVERTYSEWLQSQFAAGGVQLDGRFGGNHPTGVMETCQDCHMPDRVGPACNLGDDFPAHDDMPQHAFNGGNTWVLSAVRTLYDDWDTGLNDAIANDARARVLQMLQNASDMDLTVEDDILRVRITNYAGHKLPTGYPEGRRSWLNVRFFDQEDQLIAEHGAYDFETATLTTADTKVYEMKLGLDQAMADITGLPVGESFHFAINNTIILDNRIPPIGFTNAGFESVQAAPVDHAYADGQHWDDTEYAIPKTATAVTVTLNYQTTSREYIEFLRDENITDDRGQIAYDVWVLHGKSAPAIMDQLTLNLIGPPADLDVDGDVDAADLAILLGSWGPCPDPNDCPADFDGDGDVDAFDLALLLGTWGP